MSMKKAKIYAVIGSLFLSLNVAYATDLVVWEDLGKVDDEVDRQKVEVW